MAGLFLFASLESTRHTGAHTIFFANRGTDHSETRGGACPNAARLSNGPAKRLSFAKAGSSVVLQNENPRPVSPKTGETRQGTLGGKIRKKGWPPWASPKGA